MIVDIFKIIILGKKDNCEKLYEFLNKFCDESKIIYSDGDESNYKICFKGKMTDEYEFFNETYHPKREEKIIITDEVIKEKLNDNYLYYGGYSLKDFSNYFDVEVQLNTMDDYYIGYIHFDRDKVIKDSCPEEISLENEKREEEKARQIREEHTVYQIPEEMFGSDFYKYSDPEDHDGY